MVVHLDIKYSRIGPLQFKKRVSIRFFFGRTRNWFWRGRMSTLFAGLALARSNVSSIRLQWLYVVESQLHNGVLGGGVWEREREREKRNFFATTFSPRSFLSGVSCFGILQGETFHYCSTSWVMWWAVSLEHHCAPDRSRYPHPSLLQYISFIAQQLLTIVLCRFRLINVLLTFCRRLSRVTFYSVCRVTVKKKKPPWGC